MAPSAQGRSGIEHDQQDPRILALFFRLAMQGQHIAGEPDQVIGMVHDIGHDHTRLAQALLDPVLPRLFALTVLAVGQPP